jgi:hypothetical protein
MTTKLPPEHYLKFWEEASEQEIGIRVQVEPDDQIKFINALYECRKVHGGFENLIVMQPKPLGTIFVMKKPVELPG